MKMTRPILAVFCVALVGPTQPFLNAQENAPSLSEQAIVARNEAIKLDYEKEQAERTINGSKRQLPSLKKNLPKLKAAAEKSAQDKKAAQADLDKKKALAEDAKKKAETQNAEAKLAATKAEQERLSAEKLFRQKDSIHRRELGRHERSLEQISKLERETAAAKKAIPVKEAEAKKAHQRAEELAQQVARASEQLVLKQTPRQVAVRIDEIIDARLTKENLKPSDAVSDGEFLRRASIDVVGTIPSHDQVVSFLDEKEHSEKRAEAMERLLAASRFGRNFAQRFCAVTTEIGTTTLRQARDDFNRWLADCFNLNRRWDRVVKDLLAAEGQGYENPAVL
ncbi:MAG: DUF1549 domain-containing protein, partial [Planctomycetales bacterium]